MTEREGEEKREREGGRDRGREGGEKREREEGREGGRKRERLSTCNTHHMYTCIRLHNIHKYCTCMCFLTNSFVSK